MKKFLLCLGLTLLLAPAAAVRAQKATFNVGFSAFSAAFMPAFVAEQSGYFAQEGIGTRLVFFQSGVQLMQSVIAGDTHIGMGSAPELVTATNAGARVHGFWGISNLMPYALISRPNIKTINELRGKKIAVSARGSLSEFLASYVLRNKGLDPSKDVVYIAVGGVPTRFAALLSGSADASLISAAQFDRGRKAGLNFLFMLADLIPEWPQDLIYLKDEFVASRDADFRAFLRAYRRGIATSKKNPEVAIAAMQKAMRFDQPTARDGYNAYVASLPDDGRVGEKGFELLVDQMFDEGTIKRRLTMTDLIDYRYIHEAQKK
ncbi:MAG TPA: ABC transporter substrate-binding protein [Candidatus Binatia bacterium]|jgi:ABC-type nitrate/sulfonate/bicarbonate transport system substrate-binding protein|nr:ABC transporter substrate-binding protein [Candidatus Binatia bacterium]